MKLSIHDRGARYAKRLSQQTGITDPFMLGRIADAWAKGHEIGLRNKQNEVKRYIKINKRLRDELAQLRNSFDATAETIVRERYTSLIAERDALNAWYNEVRSVVTTGKLPKM